MKIRKDKIQVPTTVPRLSFDEIEAMLLHVLRIPAIFMDAKKQLNENLFKVEEMRYLTLWKAALNIASQSEGRLLEKGIKRRLELNIRSMLEVDPELLSVDHQDDLLHPENGFVNWCYSIPADELYEADGRALLTAFLRERTIIDPLKRFVLDSGNANPTNIGKLMRQLTEQEIKIQTANFNPVQTAWPDAWKVKHHNFTPTNIGFLDAFMTGQLGGEVYGILAGTGVGKTTIGIQLSVEGALYQQMVAKSEENLGHWFYFTYENAPDPEMITRVMSYAATVERNTLLRGQELSNSNNLKQYEMDRWSDSLKMGQRIPGETERLEAAKKKLMNRNLWLVDMSGTEDNMHHIGVGGISEVANILALEKEKGRKIAGVIIDYVLIMCKRQMANENVSLDNLRHYVGDTGDLARRLIAGPCDCPVWLLHQLTGDSNKKSPTAKMHHSESAEAKNFSDNLSYCFALGMKHPVYSTSIVYCTKERRSFSNGLNPIIYIDGAVCAVKSADHLYTVENNQIVPKNFHEKVIGNKDLVNGKPNRPSAAVISGAGFPTDVITL